MIMPTLFALVLLAQVGSDKPAPADDQAIVVDKALRDLVRKGGPRVPEVVHSVSAEDVWQTSPYRGLNCMYAFLRMEDVPVDYVDLKKNIPTTFKGASVLELQKAAGRYQISTEVLKITPAAMRGLKPPFIALLGTAQKGAVDGHYVVVCDQNGDSIRLIDGTTGHLDRVSASLFNRSFAGYVLAREGGGRAIAVGAGYTGLEVGLILGCVLNLVALFVMRSGRPSRLAA